MYKSKELAPRTQSIQQICKLKWRTIKKGLYDETQDSQRAKLYLLIKTDFIENKELGQVPGPADYYC